ncbi:O-methyltransferase, family 2 [Corchorus capsularis]|uniref:O-methyltransferase, family 2 n=1 Tax=Corchorus capsularis TaxID=210143 RepID=A0A1R3I173_COCAP|nr:O-methyltransferase, family 2 [Corchorus capsularis]
MDPEAIEAFQAQAHVYKHIFNFISSMSLKSAVELGIPDIIHNHGGPITLSELVEALNIDPTKASCIYRLMRILVHSGFFTIDEETEGYVLTPSSKILVKDKINCLSPFVMAMLHPALMTPWQFLGDWIQGNSSQRPFERANGKPIWEYMNQDSEFKNAFHGGMVSDSQMMNLVIKDCKPVFEGLNSLVDVGGGKGTIARVFSEAYPHLKWTVFDFPHVVANCKPTGNLNFVGGDLLQYIPPADAVLMKLVLHAFDDENCIKILKRCREAIPTEGAAKGKVIIIDIVINEKTDEHELTEGKLFFDMLMMVVVTGRERTEKDWEKLFLEAGFSDYKITPLFGLRYLHRPHTTVIGFENNDKEAWVERIIKADSRDIGNALTVIASNTSAATYLCSVCLTLSSLIGAWLGTSSNSFLQTRNFVHANYLITTPNCVIPVDSVKLAVLRGGDFWSLGLRALYFALNLLLWFFGPIPMFVSSVVMVFILHYLDTNTKPFHSHGDPTDDDQKKLTATRTYRGLVV